MKIYLATDHAGFALKEVVKEFLLGTGHDVEDCGATSFEKFDDYPDYIRVAAEKVSKNPYDRAIIFGGNGQGEAIVANKFPNVRAAVFYGTKQAPGAVDVTGQKSNDPYEMVRLFREHNDANVMSLSARFLTDEEALEAVKLFLSIPYSNSDRHVRRLEKIKLLEKELHE